MFGGGGMRPMMGGRFPRPSGPVVGGAFGPRGGLLPTPHHGGGILGMRPLRGMRPGGPSMTGMFSSGPRGMRGPRPPLVTGPGVPRKEEPKVESKPMEIKKEPGKFNIIRYITSHIFWSPSFNKHQCRADVKKYILSL